MRKKHTLAIILILTLSLAGVVLWNPAYFIYLYHSRSLAFAKNYTVQRVDMSSSYEPVQLGNNEIDLCSIKITEFEKPIFQKAFENGTMAIKFQNYGYLVKSLKPHNFGEYFSSLIHGINTHQKDLIRKETLSSFIEDITTLSHKDIKYFDGRDKTAIKVLKLSLQPSELTWEKFYTYDSKDKTIHITKDKYNEVVCYIVHLFPENKNEFYELIYIPLTEGTDEDLIIRKLINNISPSKQACSETQITAIMGTLAEK